MDNARLSSSLFTRLSESRRRSALFAATLFSLATLAAPSASAALREYRLQFAPSPSDDAAGYTMHVGLESGNYVGEFDLGSPPPQGGEIVYSLDLEDSVDLFVALRSYDLSGETSRFSNELRVAAIPAPAPVPAPTDGGDEGAGGSTDGGDDGSTGGGETGGETGGTTDGNTGGETGGDSGGDSAGNTGGDSGDGMGESEGAPVPLGDDVGVGLGVLPGGLMSRLLGDRSLESLTMDSLAGDGAIHPSRCDLDGDGDLDLLIGFDKKGKGRIAIIMIENGEVVSQTTLQTAPPAYRNRNTSGATWPACGDVDGDGRGEIVVGFDIMMRGVVQVLDDVTTGFAPMASERTDEAGFMQIPVPKRYWGPIFPALGDIDGDGRDEIVAGLGRGRIGRIVILDDAQDGFGVHPGNKGKHSWIDVLDVTRSKRMLAMPAVGDFDGDGKDEIAVSFGTGSGGQVAILDDAENGFPTSTDDVWYVQTGRDAYQSEDGATRSAFGDIDGDGVDELVVGFMRDGAHEVQVFDDMLSAMRPMGGVDGFVTAQNSETVVFPAPLK